MTYTIELSRTALKALKDIPPSDAKKIRNMIEKLKKEAMLMGNEKLEGYDHLYRLRAGDYRIIYQVLNKKLLILVLKIGHRREIYR